jgi:predicted dehydrogenase
MDTTSANPIRVGVMGAGQRIRTVLRRVVEESAGRITIVAAYDPDAGALAALRGDFDQRIEALPSEDALARHPGVDWVFIGSWNACHARQSIAALLAGKNVFCEKPLATQLDDCLAIGDAVRKSGRVFAFGLVLRYSPLYQKVRELVAGGAIGKIVSFEFNETLGFQHGGYIFGNWRRRGANAGSHLLEKCCHDLDLANWIIGSLPVAAASFGGRDFFLPSNAHHVGRIGPDANGTPAYAGWPDPHRVSAFSDGADIADNQVAILEFANGVRATFHTNCNSALPERRFHLCGTEGTLRADAYTGRIEWRRIGHADRTETIDLGASGGHAGGDEIMAKAVVKCLLENEPPLASLTEGLESAVVAFAVDQAMRQRAVVDLRPLWKQCGISPSA